MPGLVASDVHDLRALTNAASELPWQLIPGLYMGPLLDGFPPISSAFDDLLRNMRRAIEADVLGALGRLADRSAERGDPKQAVTISERMLAIDPLNEDTHRQLIQSYALAGRRADAIRAYNDAKTWLRQGLDVAPATQTEQLIARIRCGQDETPEYAPANTTVPPTPGGSGPPRIAVLPLRQSQDQPVPSHLSDGITADIITQLAGLRELTVISHGSTFAMRDPHMAPHEIGRKLDARYLVIGRVRRGGDRLRLTTELTEAETGQIIYSHTDDVDAAPSFDDQDRIVARLVNALVPQIRETELRRVRGKRPKVLRVYEKILLSREHIMLLNRDGFSEAKTLLDEVIEEDPGYGEAYALAAEWHSAMIGERWSTNQDTGIVEVERLNRTALSLDGCNLRALLSYGHRRSMTHRDQFGAMRMFQQALDVAPCSAHAWALSGLCLAYMGDAAEAVRRATRALELSPYDRESYKFHHALCVAHYTGGDYEQSVRWGLRALAEKTKWRGTRGFLAASLAALGRMSDAQEIVAEMRAGSPGRRINAVLNDLAYQDAGRRRLYGEHLLAAGYPE
jgi:TolB-like protein/Tfp pilus assembly protein PilF